MNAIEERWKDHRFRAIPLDASEIQVIESRRVYFAGAGAVLDLITHTIGTAASPALRSQLGELRQEVDRFRQEVLAGRA